MVDLFQPTRFEADVFFKQNLMESIIITTKVFSQQSGLEKRKEPSRYILQGEGGTSEDVYYCVTIVASGPEYFDFATERL